VKKNHDYVHHYRGYWSGSGRCPTRIYQEEGRAPGVICSQPPDDPNTSVTNMAEYLAAEVITEYKLWPVERPSGCSGWGALGDGVCHPCFEIHGRGLGCALRKHSGPQCCCSAIDATRCAGLRGIRFVDTPLSASDRPSRGYSGFVYFLEFLSERVVHPQDERGDQDHCGPQCETECPVVAPYQRHAAEEPDEQVAYLVSRGASGYHRAGLIGELGQPQGGGD
jgi:hypothetical protein